ncbi:MAG: hypothetical protein COB41_01355 [Proteobacteria bacterium]|nr:MAG: hypothetical protein COB41_01355 [Pseudomonadota bacterium]
MLLQEYLNKQRETFDFKWLTVVNAEGLTVCDSGIDEQFELAALLPDWMDTSHQLAKAAKLENGMGLICLVPKSGGYLLLMRDFEVHGERIFLLIATPKIPAKAASVVKAICNAVEKSLH